MPVINCTPDVQAQLVEKTPSRVSYTGVVAAADIGNWTVISCETSFVLLEWSIPASQQVDRILDTPRYNHTWHSSPILVNTTGNIAVAVKVSGSIKELNGNFLVTIASAVALALHCCKAHAKVYKSTENSTPVQNFVHVIKPGTTMPMQIFVQIGWVRFLPEWVKYNTIIFYLGHSKICMWCNVTFVTFWDVLSFLRHQPNRWTDF